MAMKDRGIASIKIGDKEIVIDAKLLTVLKRYVSTEMTLEDLARELGLNGWEEAYELVKKIPAWIMWTPFTMWEVTE
ncbi:MAG: hypothetical protein LM585_02015 [Fervidicoccaceae archaeon]|jgi:hypothetical protein|nr:hypothetical protein [Fervidicoccaceae archaeon]